MCIELGVITAMFSWASRNKYFKSLKWPRKGSVLSPLRLEGREQLVQG